MDPLRIAVRAVFAYVFLLVMVRLSGKQTIAWGDERLRARASVW